MGINVKNTLYLPQILQQTGNIPVTPSNPACVSNVTKKKVLKWRIKTHELQNIDMYFLWFTM